MLSFSRRSRKVFFSMTRPSHLFCTYGIVAIASCERKNPKSGGISFTGTLLGTRIDLLVHYIFFESVHIQVHIEYLITDLSGTLLQHERKDFSIGMLLLEQIINSFPRCWPKEVLRNRKSDILRYRKTFATSHIAKRAGRTLVQLSLAMINKTVNEHDLML